MDSDFEYIPVSGNQKHAIYVNIYRLNDVLHRFLVELILPLPFIPNVDYHHYLLHSIQTLQMIQHHQLLIYLLFHLNAQILLIVPPNYHRHHYLLNKVHHHNQKKRMFLLKQLALLKHHNGELTLFL